MRDVKRAITDAWNLGDFTGPRRPIGRVTVQRGNIALYDLGYNTYASLPFGAGAVHAPGANNASHVRLGGTRNNSLILAITLPGGAVFNDQSTGGPELIGSFTASSTSR